MNLSMLDWMMFFILWSLVGWLLVFGLKLRGVALNLTMYEKSGHKKLILLARCLVVVFWPIATVIVARLGMYILKNRRPS